jgi:hypothetical protein
MIEIMLNVREVLSTWLEPVGIIASLVFSGVALRNDARSRRIENHIKITDGYREVWSTLVNDPKLERIRSSKADLTHTAVTAAEDRIVRFIFQNILLTFEARKAGQLGDIGNLEKDVAEFISRPIPRAVWKEIARFQPEAFRRFIESLM